MNKKDKDPMLISKQISDVKQSSDEQSAHQQEQQQQVKPNANQVRYKRKKYAKQGMDESQQQEQQQFKKDIKRAVNQYGKKQKKRNIQQEVEYFGNMIQPFNMKDQKEMGQIDQDGYFIFKRNNQYRDAWLDSIEEGNDMMVADKVKKKIKTEGNTYRGVYDQAKKDQDINQIEQEKQDQNDDQGDQSNQNDKQSEQQQPKQQQSISLQPNQIKQLLCQLLPLNKSANAYVKQLKKKIKDPQTKQLHDKILQLCNLYIQKTNQFDILTLKKEQLEMEADQQQSQSQQVNWDQDGQDQGNKQKIRQKKQQAKYSDQDIF